MMREHLFKGFVRDFVPIKGAETITVNKNDFDGVWVEGNLRVLYEEHKEPYTSISSVYEPYSALRVMPSTVSEYTGQKDRNGKKIFEHHICRFFCDDGSGSMDYIVRWDDKKSGFVTEAVDKRFDEVEALDDFFVIRCEVVGDIFNTRVLEHD